MQWYYAIDGQRLGPVPHVEMERLMRAGTITGEALVWRQGMDQWKTLAEVKERDPALFTPVPPPLPAAEADEVTPAVVEAEVAPRSFERAVSGAGESAPEALVYAGFWQRVGAHLADLALWFFIWQILANIVVLQIFPELTKLTETITAAGGSMTYKPTPEEMVLLLESSAVALLVAMVWAVVYDTFFLLRFSATPGKLMFGLRVVRADGRPLGFMRIVARCLTKILAGVPTLGIGLLVAAFDEQKRGLHDFFSGTRVVKKR